MLNFIKVSFGQVLSDNHIQAWSKLKFNELLEQVLIDDIEIDLISFIFLLSLERIPIGKPVISILVSAVFNSPIELVH